MRGDSFSSRHYPALRFHPQSGANPHAPAFARRYTKLPKNRAAPSNMAGQKFTSDWLVAAPAPRT